MHRRQARKRNRPPSTLLLGYSTSGSDPSYTPPDTKKTKKRKRRSSRRADSDSDSPTRYRPRKRRRLSQSRKNGDDDVSISRRRKSKKAKRVIVNDSGSDGDEESEAGGMVGDEESSPVRSRARRFVARRRNPGKNSRRVKSGLSVIQLAKKMAAESKKKHLESGSSSGTSSAPSSARRKAAGLVRSSPSVPESPPNASVRGKQIVTHPIPIPIPIAPVRGEKRDVNDSSIAPSVAPNGSLVGASTSVGRPRTRSRTIRPKPKQVLPPAVKKQEIPASIVDSRFIDLLPSGGLTWAESLVYLMLLNRSPTRLGSLAPKALTIMQSRRRGVCFSISEIMSILTQVLSSREDIFVCAEWSASLENSLWGLLDRTMFEENLNQGRNTSLHGTGSIRTVLGRKSLEEVLFRSVGSSASQPDAMSAFKKLLEPCDERLSSGFARKLFYEAIGAYPNYFDVASVGPDRIALRPNRRMEIAHEKGLRSTGKGGTRT